LTELTAGATMMTVWDSSMAVDDPEMIVNETELIAFSLGCLNSLSDWRFQSGQARPYRPA